MGTISDRGVYRSQFTPYDKRHTLHFFQDEGTDFRADNLFGEVITPNKSVDLCVEVRDLFGRVITSSARIVSEYGPVTRELIDDCSNSPFGMQYFSEHNIVWIGSYGLRGGAPGTQTVQVETVQLHLRPREIDTIRSQIQRLINELNGYREHVEGLGDLLNRLSERFNEWNTQLLPRLQVIARRVESENSAVNEALRRIGENSPTRVQNLEKLIQGSVELLKALTQLKKDVESVRRALLDSQGEVQTTVDRIELDRVRLEGEILAANRTITQAEQKIKDFDKNYPGQVTGQVFLGILTLGIGTAIAEGCGAGPSACDKLRKDKNWGYDAKEKAKKENERVTKKKQKASEARDRLQQMDRQLDQLIAKLTNQHSALQRGVHSMQTYQEKTHKALDRSSALSLRLAGAAWQRTAENLGNLS